VNAGQFKAYLKERFSPANKYIWLVSAGEFFVYTRPYAVFDGDPPFFTRPKHIVTH